MARQYLVTLVSIFFQLLVFAIFARVILSWLRVGYHNAFVRFINEVTEPILGFFRRIIPPLGGVIDLSPLFAFFALDILRSIVISLLT